MRIQCAIFALLSISCAHSLRSTDPANWTELHSEHFVLRTDIPEENARASIAELELQRAALLSAGWHGIRDSSERTLVIELSSIREVNEFALKGVDGFAGRGAFGQPMIVVAEGDDHVFKHELMHILLGGYLVTQPRWVQEGLAAQVETLRFDRHNGVVVRGESRRERLDFLERFPVQSYFDEVINVGNSFLDLTAFGGFAFESAAWALVHWMVDTRPRAFDAYLARLARGENAWIAFTAEFPDLHEEQVRTAMREYLKHPRAIGVSRSPMPSWTGVIDVHPVSRAEIHATRAELFRYAPRRGAEVDRERLVQNEVAHALAEDPGNPLALWLSRDADPAAAIRAHPDDFRAWVIDYDKHHERTSIEKAAQLAPRDPGVLCRLAFAQQAAGKGEEALRNAERALDLGRMRSEVLDAVAQIFAANGRCEEARATEQRAIDALVDSDTVATPAYFRARMSDLNNHCEERQQQRGIQRTVIVSPVLRSCKQPVPRVRGPQDAMVARFTIREDGHVSSISISGTGAKGLEAAFRKYVESCSFEPSIVDGKARSLETTMELPER